MEAFGLANGAETKYPEGAAKLLALPNVKHGGVGARCRDADAIVILSFT